MWGKVTGEATTNISTNERFRMPGKKNGKLNSFLQMPEMGKRRQRASISGPKGKTGGERTS